MSKDSFDKPSETIKLARILELLEDRHSRIQGEIDKFEFPCPDCKKHVGKIKWDKEKGGECPHCCAQILAEDFKTLLDKLHNLHDERLKVNSQIRTTRDRQYDDELRKALPVWEIFLSHNCERKYFSKDLYRMLMYTFGNIAHYDLDGFYTAQFGTVERTVRTFETMSEFVKEERPFPTAHAKLENQIVNLIVETESMSKFRKRLEDEIRTRELSDLACLQKKYVNS
jgi:hypothetical protein